VSGNGIKENKMTKIELLLAWILAYLMFGMSGFNAVCIAAAVWWVINQISDYLNHRAMYNNHNQGEPK
jgi:hypothetical protein